MFHDILSENFEILWYDGIQYFDQSNVSLPKKFPSRQGQLISFGSKLSNLMFHDSLSGNFFDIVWRDGAQYRDKRSNMGPILPKIGQLILPALENFRNILA